MGKRRCEDLLSESTIDPKKEKVTEFNGTVFKAMLKEHTKAWKGLGKFISVARKLPCSDLYDVVEAYIKISMECAEIFNLLEGESQKESEVSLIFEALEMILLRTASDLSHFNMVGSTIVKKLSGYIKIIQNSLQSENYGFVRQCLSLLSAMVSQGRDAAREVLSNIHFNKSLSALSRRRDRRGKPDVRLAFTKFALSFLVSGDITTIGQILEVKELLPEILTSGINQDRISIVSLILTTLKSKVVKNTAISKTQKVRFFTPTVLADIASLYKWNGIVDAITEDSTMVEDPEHVAVSVVRELVHNFLLELCCSRKHGISFYDPSFGTAGRAGNIVLLQFLVGLKQATEDKLVSELVISTLKNSPDILARFFKETQYSFTPRLQSAWQDNVGFLKKCSILGTAFIAKFLYQIYEAQPEISTILCNREVIPLPRLLSMIMVTSIPPVCNKAFFTQGLNFANKVVQSTTLSMMAFILKRAHENMEYLRDKSVWQSSDIYTPETLEQLVQLYREALSKMLPDMTSIVSKWQLLSKDKVEGKEQTENQKSASVVGEPGSEAVDVVLLKAFVLQVIILYQKVAPHLVSQCRFDFSKLFRGIASEKGTREEIAPVLQYQILQLALELPSSKFSWFRIQNVAESESASREEPMLSLLLNMFVSSSKSHLKTSTRKLVLKVLKDSGVFEHTWKEMELWLDHLERLDPANQETVILFLEKALNRLVCSPYIYTDKVAGLVQEAAYMQANQSGLEGDAVSIPVSHIDDVLDMVDVIMDGTEGEMEEFGPALSDDLITQTFPFSGLVPAALESRNKLPADKGVVYKYMASVLTDILHCQRDPLPLCLALLHYDRELVVSGAAHPSVCCLHHYYARWIPEPCSEEFKSAPHLPNASPSPAVFAAVMRDAFSEGPGVLLEDCFRTNVEASLDSMALAEFPLAIKQTLLYVKTTVDNFGTLPKDKAAPVLKVLMGVLLDLVTKLRDFKEVNSEIIEEKSEDQSGLFLDGENCSAKEDDKEQAVASALEATFRQPCLEQWFLALERSVLPPHRLGPVRLRRLCGLLSDGMLALLSANQGRRPDLLQPYLDAAEQAVLRELQQEPGPTPTGSPSRPLRALLALHSFMEPPQVERVVSALLLLPEGRLVAAGDGEEVPAQLGVYGKAALQILTETDTADTATTLSSLDRPRRLPLSRAHLQGLGTLLTACSSLALEAFLAQELSREPGSASLVPAAVLLHCLLLEGGPPPCSQALACLLLRSSPAHRLCFQLWCLEPATMEALGGGARAHRLLPVVNTYLQVEAREGAAATLPDVRAGALKSLKKALLARLCQSVLVEEADDSVTSQHVEILTSLIRLTANVRDIRDLIDNLPTTLQRLDGYGRWPLVEVVSEKLSACGNEQDPFRTEPDFWMKGVLSAALKWLNSSYSHSKDQTCAPATQEQSILERLQQHLTSAEDISPLEWNNFVKNGLKYRYRDHHFLDALSSLLELIYGSSDILKDLLPLTTMHMMVSSHSLFLPTMLGSEKDATPESPQVKESLVSLLLCLVTKCPSVCNINHFVVLLGSYGATLSTTDQKLSLLLQEYERNNISLLKYQSFLWGPAAVEHHKAKKSLGTSLWQQASSEDLLALLDADIMANTIAHFPQNRRVIPREGKALLHKDDAKDHGKLYDPCFLLPLFSAMLQPECVVDCLKFVSSRALGLTIMALSSYDLKMRAAGYHVLSSFYQQLEGARFLQKRQLLYLMDTVRNSIRQKNIRLPFLLATYITKVAEQMLKPEEHMYVVLNSFLLGHQSLHLNRVPQFSKLLHSFAWEHKAERAWVLAVLEQGLADRHCYQLCEQQGIFHSLLAYSSSPLSDHSEQSQIFRVLCQAANVPRAAYNLTVGCGLLTWMLQMLERRFLEQHLLSGIIDLLHVLWFTNLGNKTKQAEAVPGSPSQAPVKCLPLPLVSEFLCVALGVVRHLGTSLKAARLRPFLVTLESVLLHRHTTFNLSSLQPPWGALSCGEALALLQCWAGLTRDRALLAHIHALVERHGVLPLLDAGKVKAKSKAPSPSVATATEAHEATEGQEQTMVCRACLSSIFLHWQPAPSPHASQRQGGLQRLQTSDTKDPGGLARETACLLSKWTLRCLAEGACDPGRTAAFVQWFSEAVVPHTAMVRLLLLDAGLKADLLRLYHQAWEGQQAFPLCSRVDTLKTFTTVMTHLLEAQGHQAHGLHQAVLSACLSPAHQSRRDAGLVLLSLYIQELWSGEKSAPLFLRYVDLVAGTKRSKKKSALTEAALRDMCNDIVSMNSNR